jgi:hypothetical protein
VASDLGHQVESRGCFKSIHGPFSPDDKWTQRVFQLERLGHLLDEGELPDLDGEARLAAEGARGWRLHLVIERNRSNVERKKEQAKREAGSLRCEACGFDFAEFYGDLGADFCEVHHRRPLSQLDGPVSPTLHDLAVVCSNCPRMIHRTSPMMTVEDFRDCLERQSGGRGSRTSQGVASTFSKHGSAEA